MVAYMNTEFEERVEAGCVGGLNTELLVSTMIEEQ
jgi:hypothetical protein